MAVGRIQTEADLERFVRDRLQRSDTLVRQLQAKTLPVVATGSLPAAGGSMDGKVLVEDGGAGNGNLILYVGGERFRVDGGAAF